MTRAVIGDAAKGRTFFRGEFVIAVSGSSISRGTPKVDGPIKPALAPWEDFASAPAGFAVAIEPKGRIMIPPDVAPSDLSIFTLFVQAHWIVKSVMIGLMICSVWVWAIAVDKIILY